MGFSTTITLLLASYVAQFDIYFTLSLIDILDHRGSLLQLYVLSMLAMPVSQ